MKLGIYSIYDSKAQGFSNPFYAVNAAVAIRMFRTMAMDDRTTIGQSPADFSLMYLGEFDDEVGAFVGVDAPRNLGLASGFVKSNGKGEV